MSIRSKHLAALAAAALVACGGGADTPSTPESAIGALRAQAGALRAVSATEAARQLMDFGESQFPGFFPSHQSTQSLEPFAFRYYPQTGVYLGVVVSPGSGYQTNGVYVMGGPFGNAPVLVGLLTNFITPVDPGASAGNGCFDLNLAQTEGTHIVVNYSVTGAMTGSMRIDSLVGGLTPFEGQSARLTTVATTGSGTTAQGSATIDTTMRTYSGFTAPAEIVQYGQEFVTTAQSMGFTLTTTNKTVWNPPYSEPQYTLALGQSATATLSGMLTSTMSGIPGVPAIPTTSPISHTTTTRYTARETITVPAGSFDTCRFDVTTVSSAGSSTASNWVIFGKGITVRATDTDQTSSATSIVLNGQPL